MEEEKEERKHGNMMIKRPIHRLDVFKMTSKYL